MSISAKPIAIVSGASRGIGKAMAIELLQRGYVVVGLYKSSHDAVLSLRGQDIDMQKADVAREVDIINVLEYVKQTYGRIDVVVNNVGINIFGEVESYTLQDWNTLLATNLTAAFLLSKYSLPLLKRGSNSNIINISSRRGVSTYVEPGFIAYGVSKAAVNTFTLGLAKELRGLGIRVNAIVPTPTKTDLFDETFTPEEEAMMKEKGILGLPEEVAALAMDIINDTSINGQLIFDTRVAH